MTYQEAITQKPVVLVEYYAQWCGHCQRMMPVVEQIKEIVDGRAAVVQLDIDANNELTKQENITGTPTFIVYNNGTEVWRHDGEIDGNSLLNKIESYL